MRIPTFKIRTLMILVAGVAAITAGTHFRSLGQEYQARALAHEQKSRELTFLADGVRFGPIKVKPGNDLLRFFDLAVRYHVQLQTKYERTARYPWLLVEPDPPEPE